MSKKRISHKCINCRNCSAPSIVENSYGRRKIVHRCEAGISHIKKSKYITEELVIDDRTEINCSKFSRK